jgi:hypothetical protein
VAAEAAEAAEVVVAEEEVAAPVDVHAARSAVAAASKNQADLLIATMCASD